MFLFWFKWFVGQKKKKNEVTELVSVDWLGNL